MEQRGVKSNFFSDDLVIFTKNYYQGKKIITKEKKIFLGIKSGVAEITKSYLHENKLFPF